MAYEFKARRRVEFNETDMAGIVHFSNFFRYMETAEQGLFRSLGFSIVPKPGDPRAGWPRVHATCDYHRSLRFDDLVEIHIIVVEKRSKSLRYQFRFSKVTEAATEEVARGELTVVCVTHTPDGTMKAANIPPEITDKIEVAPPEVIAG